MSRQVWARNESTYRLSDSVEVLRDLPVAIYNSNITPFDEIYLTKSCDEFTFNHKIYGVEADFIHRIVRTYENTRTNLGILLNGTKGTGKTITAKIICNNLGLPVITISEPYKDLPSFLNRIKQDVVIFIDEYEKIFSDSNVLLTVMDGMLTDKYRKIFVLTSNNVRINENMIQRPSRIRYLKTFSNLSVGVVNEIIDDLLINKEHKTQCINFIMTLPMITIDMVKCVIEEMNIHDEVPSKFHEVLNVNDINNKLHDLFLIHEDGREELFKGSCLLISPKYTYFIKSDIDQKIIVQSYNDDYSGREYLGHIKEVLSSDIVIIEKNETTLEETGKFDEEGDPIYTNINKLVRRKIRIAETSGINRTFQEHFDYAI